MQNTLNLRGALFLGTVLGGIMTSNATNVDCTTKLTPTLCTMLNQASSDSDTFSVMISFFPPANDTSEYCRNLDPKQDTDGMCSLRGYDSAYYAKLKSDADTMYTKFELWDTKNPTVRLTPPSSGKISHEGVVATKAIIIDLLKADYVSTIEEWEESFPVASISREIPGTKKLRSSRIFLPDGRTISDLSLVKGPYFFK